MANALYYGDNLDVLREHIADESVDLVYLDPPFNSKRSYNVIFARRDVHPGGEAAQVRAFDDTWRWTPETETHYTDAVGGGVPPTVADALIGMRTLLGENDMTAYLVMMAPRLVELRRVLKSTGLIYLHCDPTASHYLKLLMDAVFGADRFLNEIIWSYRTGGASKRHWSRKHDTIFLYTKSSKWFFGAQKERSYMMHKYGFKKSDFKIDPETGLQYSMVYARDVWDIPSVGSDTAERLGYPTQKPEALLTKIIEASCPEGGLVLDPFCGCGTTVTAAQNLGHRWCGIDVTYLAIDLIEKRLRHTFAEAVEGTYEVHGIPRDLLGAQALFAEDPLDFERWAVSLVNGTPNEIQVAEKGIDGVIRFFTDAKGGTGRAIVSVKGGKTIGPHFVRDLLGTVNTQSAQMGVLVSLSDPTRGMIDAADHAGTYVWPVDGRAFPKVQLVTIADLLAGKRLRMPLTMTPYIAAQRLKPLTMDQTTLDLG